MKKQILTIAIAVFAVLQINAQNGVSVNTTGAAADPSAMLDVSSSNKGVLIPRITEAERLLISNPARGLMVYQIDNADGFWYYDGSAWGQFGDNLGNHIATDTLNMSNKKITNLATCTQNLDAANKEYVDNVLSAGGGGATKPSMISNESATAYTYSDAVQYCESLNEGGYNDWWLPSTDEMLFFTGVSGATTNFLWTKTTTKPQMFSGNQNFETVRLTDGKWRNGIETIRPLVAYGVNNTTTLSTPWVTFGTIAPSNPANLLSVTHIQLEGLCVSSYQANFRILLNYADGTSEYSPTFVTRGYPAAILYKWENKDNPILFSSLTLEGFSTSSGYTTYGTLTISGHEIPHDQKDGNTLYARCVR